MPLVRDLSGNAPAIDPHLEDVDDVNVVSTVGGGGGSGTEYTEDGAAVANPTGGAIMLVRRDSPSVSEVTADGDIITWRGNSRGFAYVTDIDVLAKLNAGVAVTGTFWQATQPISGSISVTGSVAVTGTFWQATQPVSIAALPLPTGAATDAGLAGLIK